MIKKLYYISIALTGIWLSLAGCEQSDVTPGGDGGNVYLTITRAVPSGDDGTSINADATDFEDRVHNFAMLIFDSSADENASSRVGEYVEMNISRTQPDKHTFVVKLGKPGTYDFYFVANMGMTSADAQTITTKKQMKDYLSQLRDLTPDLYNLGADDTGRGFPMSRAYLGEVIEAGGSVYQPELFKPNHKADDKVILIRATSKLEVTFNADEFANVKAVYYHNANRKFSLGESKTTAITASDLFNDAARIKLTKTAGYSYIYYMPEAVMPASVSSWTDGAANSPVNFFVIETIDGNKFEVPIISNATPAADDYLKIAKGKVPTIPPDYTIERNYHYKYTVNNLKKIEINYEVVPWNKVERQLYMGYGYNVEVDEYGNVTVTNTIDNCLPHKVKLVAKNEAYFGTDASATTWEYGYTDTSDSGYDPNKLKSGNPENKNINTINVASGAVYLEVFYNGVSVKTFTKE